MGGVSCEGGICPAVFDGCVAGGHEVVSGKDGVDVVPPIP